MRVTLLEVITMGDVQLILLMLVRTALKMQGGFSTRVISRGHVTGRKTTITAHSVILMGGVLPVMMTMGRTSF